MRNTSLTALLITTGVIWSTPALAQWETAHGHALETGERCPDPHGEKPQLRRSDNRPFDIPAGFKGEIEIYGHGVDLIRDVRVSNESWARYARGVGGPENNARGCDAIGSIVIKFDVSDEEPAATHTLRFGDQSMQVRIVKPTITGTVWSEQTMEGSSTLPSGSPPRPPAPPPPPPPPQATGTHSTGCGPAGGSNCGGSSSAVSVGGSGTSAPFDAPPRLPDGIGGCIKDLGGSIVQNGRTLTITLPPVRSEQYDIPCLTRPIYFNLVTREPADDVGGFRAGVTGQFRQNPGRAVDPPQYRGALSGFTGPTVIATPDRDYQSLRMTGELARTFVGERSITLRPSGGAGTPGELTLVIRTVPGNGIRDVVGVPFSGPRTASDFDVKFDFKSGSAVEVVNWRLRAVGGPAPSSCFAATSGTVTSFGGGVGKFGLRAREAAGCDNARFALDIAPEGASFTQALFAKTVEFALIPRTAPALQPGSITRPQPRPIGN